MAVDKNITIKQEADIICSLLPKGIMWEAVKSNIATNVRNMILAFAAMYNQIRLGQYEIQKELNIFTTDRLIDEWEKKFKIDPNIWPPVSTLEERRQRLLLKITGFNVVTRKQIINLINQIFNIQIQISRLDNNEFDYLFDIEYMISNEDVNRRITLVQCPASIANTNTANLIESIIKLLFAFKGIIIFRYNL